MKNVRVDPDDDGSPEEDDSFLDMKPRTALEARLKRLSQRRGQDIAIELDKRALKLARLMRDYEKTIPH